MKKEKVYCQKTKRFTITFQGSEALGQSIEIRRRLSKEERKAQKRMDEENAVASVVFSPLDEYKCSEMKVRTENSGLTSDEWAEVLKVLLDYCVKMWNIVFVSTDKSSLPADMLPAINDFKEDPVKPGMHYFEVPVTTLFAALWLLGMSLGMSLGSSSDNMALGMCIGMSMGMCIGLALDSAAKKERNDLKVSRGMPVEEPEKNNKK